MKSICPLCGDEVEIVSTFNIRAPQRQKRLLLHRENNCCPASCNAFDAKDQAFNMDCLEGMRFIPDGSVDLVLCDLPYGTTHNKWDVVIPFSALWEQYERVVKENGAIILFSDGLFTVQLIQSNMKLWRYNLVWDKARGCDFLNANIKPLKSHEDIVVFYRKKPTFNKQFWYSTPYKPTKNGSLSDNYGDRATVVSESEDGRRNPLSILRFPRDAEKLHPTQKPVALLEYLIRTYSNDGDTVLDNCFGSGSTLVAALNCGRSCIGFEQEPKYFEIASHRLERRT